MPVKKIKKGEDWREFIPRGTKARLAEKYNLSEPGVTAIIKREDVLNHPELIDEAREVALRVMEMCNKHANAVKNALSN